MLKNELFATNKTVLAPMAGYTDVAFRHLCSSYGAGLTVTEMVSSKALVMGNVNTLSLLARADNSPCFVQIFGHEPSVMAESVTLPALQGFDGIDINMGCPVHKIVSNGEGSALLENPKLASEIISKVKLAVNDKPLSVKFRLGVSNSTNAVDFAKMCADSGADFVTVHFRTRKQMYSGQADYSLLEDICKCGVPVVANGDITSKEKADELLCRGASAVAVGRGALGKPYIFSLINDKEYSFDIHKAITEQTLLLLNYLPDRVVANEMKKHVAFYLKGIRNAKNTIVAVQNCKSTDELLQLVNNFFATNGEIIVK